jgi:hypothetical protein
VVVRRRRQFTGAAVAFGFGLGPPALGRYLTMHPALILVGEHRREYLQLQRPSEELLSATSSGAVHGFLLETCMYFPFTTPKNLIGFGAEHSELMRPFLDCR